MKNKSIFLYAPIYLALIIPAPGRFVFGFTLFFEMMFLTLVGTLTVSLVKKLDLEKMMTAIVLIAIVSATILFRQIIVLLCAEIALTLGFIIYLPAISLLLIGILFNNNELSLPVRMKKNFSIIGIFSVLGLLFFLLRDILGYGTFTFIGRNHLIYEKIIINNDNWAIFSFMASIPGALILAGIILYLAILIRKKIHIIKNLDVVEEDEKWFI